MKRPLLLLPLLALAAGCATPTYHLRTQDGAPVADALVIWSESWLPGNRFVSFFCPRKPVRWCTRAMLTDEEGTATLPAKVRTKAYRGAPILVSPDLKRFYIMALDEADAPPLESFSFVDFSAGGRNQRDVFWLNRAIEETPVAACMFVPGHEKKGTELYFRLNRLREEALRTDENGGIPSQPPAYETEARTTEP